MIVENSKVHIQEELLLAKQSRIEGNEGRARVCARRAAGAAAADFLKRNGYPAKDTSVFHSLTTFQNIEGLPKRVQVAITRLVQHVDQEHQLPPGIDLIDEAKLLISFTETGN